MCVSSSERVNFNLALSFFNVEYLSSSMNLMVIGSTDGIHVSIC